MSRWFDAIEPVTVPVDCGGARHQVSWRRGRLVLHDHPNLTAERALVALGADPSWCVEMLMAWQSVAPDARLVARLTWLVGAWPAVADPLDRPPVPRPERWMLTDPEIRAEVLRYHELILRQSVIERLPIELAVRWLLGSTATFERGWADLTMRDLLDLQLLLGAAARRAVVRGLRSWQRLSRVQRLTIGCRLAPPGTEAAMTGRVDEHRAEADVDLPLAWFARVWGPGLTVVDGCFVLDVSGDRATVVRWQRTGPAVSEAVTVPARLWLDGEGGWRLRLVR